MRISFSTNLRGVISGHVYVQIRIVEKMWEREGHALGCAFEERLDLGDTRVGDTDEEIRTESVYCFLDSVMYRLWVPYICETIDGQR